MSNMQRLEVSDSLISRGDTTTAPAHNGTLQDAPERRSPLQAIAMVWRIWRERRAARRALATIDARTLRDIGIAPELVDYELWRSSWRPLLDWHAVRYVHGVDVSEPRRSRSGSARDDTRRPRFI